MLYLSQLLGAPVEDHQGARAGKIVDITVPVAQLGRPEAAVPRALLIEDHEGQRWQIPLDAVEWREGTPRLRLPLAQYSLHPAELPEEEISLAEDVLDKQVIDIERKKAVRVNDVCFGDDWHLLGIDNSTLGLVRRLAPNWLLGTNIRRSPTNLIPWEHVELIGTQQPDEQLLEETGTPVPGTQEAGETLRTRSGTLARTPSGHLAELHPADI